MEIIIVEKLIHVACSVQVLKCIYLFILNQNNLGKSSQI